MSLFSVKQFLQCILICLILVAPHEAPAQPASVPQAYKAIKGQVIIFDASNGKYQYLDGRSRGSNQPGRSWLNASETVTVVIIHPNRFTRKYTVSKLVSDVSSPVPGTLANLFIALATPTPTARQSREGLITKIVALQPSNKPEEQAFNQALAKYKQAHDDYDKEKEKIDLVIATVVGQIKAEPYDYDIRKAVIPTIQSLLPSTSDIRAINSLVSLPEADPSNVTHQTASQLFEDNVPTFTSTPMIDSIRVVGNQIVTNPTDSLSAANQKFQMAAVALKSAYINVSKLLEDKTKIDASADLQPNLRDPDLGGHPISIVSLIDTETATDVDLANYSSKLMNLRKFYLTLLDPSVFPTRISIPQGKINHDTVTFSIQVETIQIKVDDSSSPSSTSNLPFTDAVVEAGTYLSSSLPIYGRLVVDFSAGLGFTNLVNRNYFTSGTTNIVNRGISDNGNLGPTVLGTVHCTTRSGLSIGPSLGFLVGVGGGASSRLLAGATLNYRMSQQIRFNLSYGWAYGQVTQLNGDVVGQPAANGKSVSTQSVYRGGNFLAATFSFSL